MRIQVVMSLPREAPSVPLARRTVATALTSAGVTRECVGEVEVALSEACTNVFRHAGHGQGYEVIISIGDEQITMDVVDSGAGFGDLQAHTSHVAEPHAESGRGMTLMRALTDRAVFDTVTGGGGSVHLMKRLRWANDRPGWDHTAGTAGGFDVPAHIAEPGQAMQDGRAANETDTPSYQAHSTPKAAGGAEDGAPAPPAGT